MTTNNIDVKDEENWAYEEYMETDNIDIDEENREIAENVGDKLQEKVRIWKRREKKKRKKHCKFKTKRNKKKQKAKLTN